MGGGLMQLVTRGVHDVYLTGSPEITFFRAVYKRHTPFATHLVEQTLEHSANWGATVSSTIARHGDLLTDLFVVLTLPEAGVPESDPSRVLGPFDADDFDHDGTHFVDAHGTPLDEPALSEISTAPNLYEFLERYPALVYRGRAHSWQYANSVAHRVIEACEIHIGGQRVDTHYGLFYEAWNELHVPEERRVGYGRMIGKLYDERTGAPLDRVAVRGAPGQWTFERRLYEKSGVGGHMGHTGPLTLYVPLRFWFHQHPGLALPLCALHPSLDVTVRLVLAPWDRRLFLNRRVKTSTGLPDRAFGVRTRAPPALALWAEYVFLGEDERRRLGDVSHEYLITQLQRAPEYPLSCKDPLVRVPLPFDHPVIELIWFVRRVDAVDAFEFGQSAPYDYLDGTHVALHADDVRDLRPSSYYRQLVPFYCHTRIPARHVYCHAFALRPERADRPSGSANFSRLRHAALHVRVAPSSRREGTDAFQPDTDDSVPASLGAVMSDDRFHIHVFALSYNVLRITKQSVELRNRSTVTEAVF